MQLYESLLLNSKRIVDQAVQHEQVRPVGKCQLEQAWNLELQFYYVLFGCRKNTRAINPFKKSEMMRKPLKLQIYAIMVKHIKYRQI